MHKKTLVMEFSPNDNNGYFWVVTENFLMIMNHFIKILPLLKKNFLSKSTDS